MSARDKMIEAIRRRLGRRKADPVAIAAAARVLLDDPENGRPFAIEGDLAAFFAARLVSSKVVGASVATVRDFDEVPGAVRTYCQTRGLDCAIALQPDPLLQQLDWGRLQTKSSIDPNETVAVARALFGIAETGTLAFHSGPASPTLFSFLPLHHIGIIEQGRILAYLEDYALAVKDMETPRNVNLVTGASGTADIEATLVKGAHGPAFLHVIVVDARA